MKPVMDIFENEKELILSLEMPGVKEDSIGFEFEGNALNVSANTAWGSFEDLDSGWDDILPRRYQQSIQLPENVDKNAIQAELKKGRLTLQLPKAQQLFQAA